MHAPEARVESCKNPQFPQIGYAHEERVRGVRTDSSTEEGEDGQQQGGFRQQTEQGQLVEGFGIEGEGKGVFRLKRRSGGQRLVAVEVVRVLPES
jgi:hypothetical protein